MLLILHASCPHGHIRKQIGQELMILGIQHFVGAGKAGLLQCMEVQTPYGHQPLEQIRVGNGVGLMKHAFVADPSGARLVGIDARHYHYFVGHFVL